jgi:hypothetical protein
MSLNGADDEVQVPNSNSLNVANMALSGWFWANTNDGETIFWTGAVNQFIYLREGNLRVFTGAVLLTTPVSATTWHHFVYTYDVNGSYLFLDGGLADSSLLFFPFNSGATRVFGRSNVGYPFGGRLDDLRLYNRGLSAAESRHIYDRGRAAPLSDLARPIGSRIFLPAATDTVDWLSPLSTPPQPLPRLQPPDRIQREELFLWPPTIDGSRADAIRVKKASLEIRHLVPVRTLPGVVVLAVAGRNGPGMGRLKSSGDGTLIAWQAPGSATFGAAVDCSSDGTYLLEDGEDVGKWLRVQVYADNLSPTPRSVRIHLGDLYANGPPHDDVTAAEATAGDVTIYSLILANDSPQNISALTVWLNAATDDLEISDDGAAWVNPTSEGAGLVLGSVDSGESKTLWLRRTIGAGADSDPAVLTHLHYAFSSL